MRGKVKEWDTENQVLGITPAYAGKRIFLTFQLFNFAGSPPPMRGKVPKIEDGIDFIRITPAYAGKSSVTVAVPLIP